MKLLPILVFSLLAGPAFALELQHVDTYDVPPDRVVDSQVVVLAGKADIRGRVTDDLFLLVNDGSMTGELENDGWLFAATLKVSGRVDDHLRIVANTATVSGTISNGMTAVAGTLQLTRDSHIDGSANIAAGTATLEGYVGSNVRLVAEEVTISGEIHGDVRLYANDIVIMPGTVIDGDLVYTSQKELLLDNKVNLKGKLTRKFVEQASPELPDVTPMEVIVIQFLFLAAALMVGIPLAGLFPRLTGHAVRLIRHSSLKCAFIGTVCFCLMPMVATLVFATLVGIPLGLAMITLYVLVLYLSKIVVAIALGGVVMRWRGPQPFGRVVLALSFGLVLLYTATALPIVGPAVWFIVTFIGVGGLVLGAFQTQTTVEPPPLS